MSRPPLVTLGLGLAVLAAGAAVAPLTFFGLLAPVPAAVGMVLVLGSVVRARGPDARHATLGLATVALGLLALLAAALQAALLVDGARYGVTEGRETATVLLVLLLAGALAAVLGGFRLRGVRAGGRIAAVVLLVPPLAALLLLLLSTAFPTRA